VTTHSSRLERRTRSSFPEDVPEMVTLFHVTAGYTYIDRYGVALGYQDVFTKLEAASRHYESVGLGKNHVGRIVR
jgi:2,4'-dihydroxyacetophenone dioxygenase